MTDLVEFDFYDSTLLVTVEVLEAGPKGFSPHIEVKENSNTTYILTVHNEDGSFDTPNLKAGGSGIGNIVSNEIDIIKVLDFSDYEKLEVKDKKTLYLIRG